MSAIMVHFQAGDASGKRGRHFLYHGEMEGAINLAAVLTAAGRRGTVGRASEWRAGKAIQQEGNIRTVSCTVRKARGTVREGSRGVCRGGFCRFVRSYQANDTI